MSNPAEMYESYMVPTLFGPWASDLISAADPQKGERVIDVGCGTGIVARQVADKIGNTGTVAGLDLSPNMLAVAKRIAEDASPTVNWHEGEAESLPFPDGSFDVALCQYALMFFADQRRAVKEMYRVLVPGGRMAISVWQGLDKHPFYQKLHNVIYERFEMSGVQTIFSLGDGKQLDEMLAEAGFENVDIKYAAKISRFPNPDGFLAGEIAVDTAAIPAMQDLGDAERQKIIEAISDDMRGALAEVTKDEHVELEFHAMLARGGK